MPTQGIWGGVCPKCEALTTRLVPLNAETMWVDDAGITHARDPWMICSGCGFRFNPQFDG